METTNTPSKSKRTPPQETRIMPHDISLRGKLEGS
jgi:hypothetical protein